MDRRAPVHPARHRAVARRATLTGLALLAGLAIAVAWPSSATARPATPDRPPGADQPRDCDPAPICPPDREPIQDRPYDPGPVDTGEEARCLKRFGDMTDASWQMVFNGAQTQAWMLEYMGWNPAPGDADSVWSRLLRGVSGTLGAGPNGGINAYLTDLTETVPIRLPWYVYEPAARWYIQEAQEEAENHRNCALARHVPTGSCDEIRAGGESVTRRDIVGILPDLCWGNYPSSAFDLHYDNSGFLDHKIWAITTGLVHAIGKGAIQVMLALIGWAFVTFQTGDYSPIADAAAGQYHTELIQRFDQVTQLAWIVLFGFAGFNALRGKLAVAGGEIIMSIVAVGLATFMMVNRAGYLDGAADTVDKVSVTLLAAGSAEQEPVAARGEDTSATRAEVIEPLQRTLHEEFVELPFNHIHFGVGELPDECERRRNAILWAGVHRDGGWAQRYMRGGHGPVPAEGGNPARPASQRADCSALADSMGEPNSTRFLTALVTAAVACMVAFLLGSVALTVLLSKVLLMFVFTILPFTLVATILPGAGRRMAWGMAGTGVQAGAAEIGMSFVLSFLMVTLDGVHRLLGQMGLFERWIVVGLLLLVVFWVRSRWLTATRSMATNITNALTRAAPGGRNHPGGEEGVDLSHSERAVGRGLAFATPYATVAAGAGAAIGLGAARGLSKAVVTPQLHRRRDRRNQRWAADNLRRNRAELQRLEQRPTFTLTRTFGAAAEGVPKAGGSPSPQPQPPPPSRSLIPFRRRQRPQPAADPGHHGPGPMPTNPPLDNHGLFAALQEQGVQVTATMKVPYPRTPGELQRFGANLETFMGGRGQHFAETTETVGPDLGGKDRKRVFRERRDIWRRDTGWVSPTRRRVASGARRVRRAAGRARFW